MAVISSVASSMVQYSETRHVDGGQALAAELVERAAGLDGQARRRDVDAQRDRACPEPGDREGVVDFGGLRVVDGKRLYLGQRQVGRGLRGVQRRKARALGEVVQQKALPVELVARINGARLLQQIQRCGVRGAAGLHHGFVFGRVLVGTEQNFVELFANRCGADTLSELFGPFGNLRQHGFFLLDGGQRLLQDVGRGLLETPLARAAEVVRRLVQAKQRGGLLGQRGVLGKIITCQIGKAKFALGGEFPGELQVNGLRQHLALCEQVGGRGLFELEQDMGRLGLDPFARVELDLGRGFSLGEDAAGQKFAGFFKQCVHGGHCPMRASRARRAGLSAPKYSKMRAACACMVCVFGLFYPFF